VIAFLETLGRPILYLVEEMGRIFIFSLKTMAWMVRPPFKLRNILKQMEFVGVQSIYVVLLTGVFTGAVMALQSYYGFRLFSAEAMVGTTVALAMTRELGPVLTSLMVTARAGSAMAAELGTMRVTEQIDALTVMAANPIKHLGVPRVVAGITMLPLLTAFAVYVGIAGSYLVGVKILGIEEGSFVQRITQLVQPDDIFHGLFKAAIFGLIISLIGCYKGFHARGGAEGVGRATTEAVVLSSVSILASDYIIEALLFY